MQATAMKADPKIRRQVANQLTDVMRTDFYDLLDHKQTNLWSDFKDLGLHAIADVTAKLAETNLILPATIDILGLIGGVSGVAGSVSGEGTGSLADLLGSSPPAGSLGNLLSNSAPAGSLTNLVSNGGWLTNAGSYLFGSSTGVGDISTAGTSATSLDIPTWGVEGENGVFGGGAATFDGIAPATIPGSTDGLLMSGGFQSLGLGSLGQLVGGIGGGMFAGNLLNGLAGGNSTGGMVGSLAGSIGGYLLGGPLGGILGGTAGGLLGGIKGPGPEGIVKNECSFRLLRTAPASSGIGHRDVHPGNRPAPHGFRGQDNSNQPPKVRTVRARPNESSGDFRSRIAA